MSDFVETPGFRELPAPAQEYASEVLPAFLLRAVRRAGRRAGRHRGRRPQARPARGRRVARAAELGACRRSRSLRCVPRLARRAGAAVGRGYARTVCPRPEGRLRRANGRDTAKTITNPGSKLGRNDPCPCGSASSTRSAACGGSGRRTRDTYSTSARPLEALRFPVMLRVALSASLLFAFLACGGAGASDPAPPAESWRSELFSRVVVACVHGCIGALPAGLLVRGLPERRGAPARRRRASERPMPSRTSGRIPPVPRIATAALQAALDAGDHQVVFLPEGFYRVDGLLTVTRPGVVLRGVGPSSRVSTSPATPR